MVKRGNIGLHMRTKSLAYASRGIANTPPAVRILLAVGAHRGGCNKWCEHRQILTVSISLRLSSNADLSLMSLLATQVFIWSRNRWSFLICVFRSVSSFSFCVWFVDACILSYMLSKSSTPSDTFFKVLSISAAQMVCERGSHAIEVGARTLQLSRCHGVVEEV